MEEVARDEFKASLMLRGVSPVHLELALRWDLRKLVRNSTLRDMTVESGLVSQQQRVVPAPASLYAASCRLLGCRAVAMAAKPQAVGFQYRNAFVAESELVRCTQAVPERRGRGRIRPASSMRVGEPPGLVVTRGELV
jgi:hypothetical protein